jgi:hypothetical protein
MRYPWATHIDHDAFDELDLSPNPHPNSGQIGCMTRRLADLGRAEAQLMQELAFVHAAQRVALKAMDNFILLSPTNAPATAGDPND